MRFTLLSLLVIHNALSFAQSVQISGGPAYNKFFNYSGSEYNPEYGSGGAYTFSFGYQNSSDRNWRYGLELNLLNYSGYFKTKSFGFSHSENHTASVRNTSLGLGFYPVNLRSGNDKIRFQLGVGVDYVIHSGMDGTRFSSSLSADGFTQPMDPSEGRKLIVSLKSNLGYAFRLNDQWSLSPRLNYLIGVTTDYHYEQPVRKMIASFEIGIHRKL